MDSIDRLYNAVMASPVSGDFDIAEPEDWWGVMDQHGHVVACFEDVSDAERYANAVLRGKLCRVVQPLWLDLEEA